ncbi:hypothetical protein L3Q82_001823 [Scortum barcoo]|uniref:Uncharacterized protein n=1 Tax=Scortum barcoo TaxID=214431 RepID=A0ACB8W550_9TELE|nr:hypothetical protein L3Q82_001823 [Scortum barcoo]
MKSCGSQTWTPSGPWLRLEILSIKIMNRTGDVTKGSSPAGVQHVLGTGLTYCRQCEPSSCSGRTETEQPLAKAPGPHTHGALPTEYHEGHGRMPSPDPQSTCGLVGQTPINPQAPCMESIELVQCSTTGTKTALFLLNPRVDYRPNSPLQYPGVDLPREAEKCDPPVLGTHSPVPLFKKRDHHPRFATPPRGTVPNLHAMLQRACQPRQPHNIQRLEVLRADLIHPRRLATATEELANYLSDFGSGDGQESTSESPASASSLEGKSKYLRISSIPPTLTAFSNSTSSTFSFFPPAGTRQLRQESHRPTWPDRDSFFSLTASLTSGVHHQVRGLPPRQAPETLRPQLRTAAIDNGGREHGPLGLNVPSLPRNL